MAALPLGINPVPGRTACFFTSSEGQNEARIEGEVAMPYFDGRRTAEQAHKHPPRGDGLVGVPLHNGRASTARPPRSDWHRTLHRGTAPVRVCVWTPRWCCWECAWTPRRTSWRCSLCQCTPLRQTPCAWLPSPLPQKDASSAAGATGTCMS